jgi:hypothetical protein
MTKTERLVRSVFAASALWLWAPHPVLAQPDSRVLPAEAVFQKIRPCWRGHVETSKKIPEARIIVQMDRDGRPVSAEAQDTGRYNSDPDYRSVADTALRAVRNPRCQPWPLPVDKYESWRKLTLTFYNDA